MSDGWRLFLRNANFAITTVMNHKSALSRHSCRVSPNHGNLAQSKMDAKKMDDAIDLNALRDSVADVLSQECSIEAVMHHVANTNGPLLPLWQTATELGWMALSIGEDEGGLGLGIEALAVVYEAMGHTAAPLPYLVTMLTAEAIRRSGTDAQRAEWLPKIAAGAIATLAAPAPVAGVLPHIQLHADHVVICGVADHILDARDAAIMLILTQDTAGALHRVIVTPQDKVTSATKVLWDHGHSLSALTFDTLSLPASRAFAVDMASEEELLIHAAIGASAEAVGGLDAVLSLTIDYLKTRQQFGKAIGTFQALKHRIADHQTRLVAARVLLQSAVAKAASNAPDAAEEASAAKAFACAAFAETARDCVQLHGGMGFTEETAVHVYMKRAHLLAHIFGDAHWHNVRAVQSILNAEAA